MVGGSSWERSLHNQQQDVIGWGFCGRAGMHDVDQEGCFVAEGVSPLRCLPLAARLRNDLAVAFGYGSKVAIG